MEIKIGSKIFASVKNYMVRRKAVANARYAFKHYDLKTDVHTVGHRLRNKNGDTVGIILKENIPEQLPARGNQITFNQNLADKESILASLKHESPGHCYA